VDVFVDNFDVYWQGFRTTVSLTALSFALAIAIGTVLATFRVSPIRPLRLAATTYVEIVRNTPLTVHILLAFFGWPKLGFRFGPFTTAVIVLAYYTGAFVGETIRAGINTVGQGQVDAARAVGLRFDQVLGKVVLPQAVRSVVAPLGSVLSALVRNSAVAYVISVHDLMGVSDRLITETARPVPVLLGAAISYYAITIPLAFFINYVDRHQRFVR
jgi:glutamate transport system permease protein